MKKLIAMLLALMLVLVSVAAMADDPDTGTNPDQNPVQTTDTQPAANTPNLAEGTVEPSAAQTITINKVYTITLPKDVLEDKTLLKNYSLTKDSLSFTVTGSVKEGSSTVTTAPAVEVDALDVTEVTITDTDIDENNVVTKEYPLKVTIPAYSEVGIYEYKIEETKGDYQGVGYHTSPLYLRVTVARNTQEDKLYIAGIALRSTSAEDTAVSSKIDSLENKYGAGRLSVTKEVKGNMGDQSQDFSITVTFEAEKKVGATIKYSGADNTGTIAFTEKDGKYTGSATLTIHHGETVQFENIPAGVTYKVEEDTSETSAYAKQGYTQVDYENENGSIDAAADIDAKVKNTKEVTVDTGITLETLPYVMLMALAALGFVALKLRKREEY